MMLRSRLYPSARMKPILIHMPTRCVLPARFPGPRYPLAESVLDDAIIQPYVHDCMVLVHEGSQVHRFRVFYKRHCHLPVNRSFAGRRILRGDIVVMRAGVLCPLSVVNMRGRDTAVSDWMIHRWVKIESPVFCYSFRIIDLCTDWLLSAFHTC